MSPAAFVDGLSTIDAIHSAQPDPKSAARTLLLSPPSLASHPEKLDDVLAAHDRSVTDMQMLDRLSLSLVSLPEATYGVILLLTGFDGTQSEAKSLLSRTVINRIAEALEPGGRLRTQSGRSAVEDQQLRNEAVFAGLLIDGDDMVKPQHDSTEAVPLRLGKGKEKARLSATTSAAGTGAVSLNLIGLSKNGPSAVGKPAGVGFVDFSDDLDPDAGDEDGDEDELIDEDALLNDEDLQRPILQPPECRPKTGKRRRACKDCTCGLAQKIASEDETNRSIADQNLAKLKTDELAEVDFTVQGKVGSCGNCALGDAFRCDGCPYIGLPAFKPGEEVRLIDDEVQL